MMVKSTIGKKRRWAGRVAQQLSPSAMATTRVVEQNSQTNQLSDYHTTGFIASN